MASEHKTVIGLTVPVLFINGTKKKQVMARVDTGATQSSIDTSLATELNLGPIVSTKLVKSSHGTSLRAVVSAEFILAKKRLRAKFNLSDRRHMRYRVLLGINALRKHHLLISADKE